MNTSGINADTVWAATLPPISATKQLGYEYDATMNYTQGQVSLVKRIGK